MNITLVHDYQIKLFMFRAYAVCPPYDNRQSPLLLMDISTVLKDSTTYLNCDIIVSDVGHSVVHQTDK